LTSCSSRKSAISEAPPLAAFRSELQGLLHQRGEAATSSNGGM
jgi:hypothetical protein